MEEGKYLEVCWEEAYFLSKSQTIYFPGRSSIWTPELYKTRFMQKKVTPYLFFKALTVRVAIPFQMRCFSHRYEQKWFMI